MQEKIQLLEKINKVKLQDLNYDFYAKSMAELVKIEVTQTRNLKILEPVAGFNMDSKRALTIWKCLLKHFGQDFFLEAVENEFGITPEGNKHLLAQIKDMYRLSIEQYLQEISDLQTFQKDQAYCLNTVIDQKS